MTNFSEISTSIGATWYMFTAKKWKLTPLYFLTNGWKKEKRDKKRIKVFVPGA